MAMGHIVVVDDAEILNMMELLLSMAGYQTILHNSGKAAYSLIRHEQFMLPSAWPSRSA